MFAPDATAEDVTPSIKVYDPSGTLLDAVDGEPVAMENDEGFCEASPVSVSLPAFNI
jgi:hypothetical protein